jgi:hypothetical protein
MQDHGRGRKADVGLDGEASWRIRILATSAIPKRRKGKTRGVASNRWQIYEAQLGPIAPGGGVECLLVAHSRT